MRCTMNTNLAIRSAFAIAVSFVVAGALWSPTQARSAEPMPASTAMPAGMMEHCREMQADKQKMNDDIKAQNEALSAQVARMNNAPHDQKLDLLAAVVTDMAQQRVAMDARRAKMQEQMMHHMMQHMQMGKTPMAHCPMMDEKAAN